MRILLIGGGGLIGSGLENLLFDDGHQTLVLDTFTGSSLRLAGIKGKVITGNSTSFSIMNNVFSSFYPEVVFNFVDASSDKEGYYNFQQEADVFVDTSMNLARCMEIYGCVKHVFIGSSCDVYKGGSKRKLKETSAIEPMSYTGVTKLYIENMFSLLVETTKVSVTSLRFFQIYGNRYFINPKYDVISIYLDSIIRGYRIAIAGPKTYVDLLNVADAVSAVYIIFMHVISGETVNCVNIGSGNAITLIDLYNTLSKRLDVPSQPTVIPAGRQTRSLVADISKLENIGWRKQNVLEELIDTLIDFRMRVINDRPGF